MDKRKKPNFIKEEKRTDYIKKIISFFLDERNEEIGIIAAEKVLNFFTEDIGKEFYKQGVKDTRKLFEEKMDDLKVNFDLLSEN